jgi:CRISPR/Cas system-associated endonuclease/helicase Cas3
LVNTSSLQQQWHDARVRWLLEAIVIMQTVALSETHDTMSSHINREILFSTENIRRLYMQQWNTAESTVYSLQSRVHKEWKQTNQSQSESAAVVRQLLHNSAKLFVKKACIKVAEHGLLMVLQH